MHGTHPDDSNKLSYYVYEMVKVRKDGTETKRGACIYCNAWHDLIKKGEVTIVHQN